MKPIQLVLEVGTIVALFFYMGRLRNQFRDRLLVLVFFTLCLVAVLVPDRVTDLAQELGVGRGTDLVLYVLGLFSIYIWLLYYSKIGMLERNQTELIRALAIQMASKPSHAREK